MVFKILKLNWWHVFHKNEDKSKFNELWFGIRTDFSATFEISINIFLQVCTMCNIHDATLIIGCYKIKIWMCSVLTCGPIL